MKKVKRYLFQKFVNVSVNYYKRKYSKRVYKGIDEMPIYNWWQINSSADLSFVLIDKPKKKLNRFQIESLSFYWEKIYNEYISVFGFSEDFLRQLEKKKEIAILKLQMVVTDDYSLQTMIDIANIELQQMQEDISGQSDFYESKATMESRLGFVLDPRKITVREFYSYIKNLRKNIKK